MPKGGAGAFAASILKILGFYFIRRASPISGVRLAAPMVLAQRKGHERICEAIRHVLPPV